VKLEPEYQSVYAAWKAAPGPQTNNEFLKVLTPAIEKGVKATVGTTNPLLLSRARGITLQAIKTYDPSKAQLNTHLRNQFKGLKRIHRQIGQPIKIPERIVLQHGRLQQVSEELQAELGREPSDAELASTAGISLSRLKKIRTYRPAVAVGTFQSADEEDDEDFVPLSHSLSQPKNLWEKIVYDELSPLDQLIMEMSLGLHGQPALQNHEIAKRLKRSPGLISQRKKIIQDKLDQEAELSLL